MKLYVLAPFNFPAPYVIIDVFRTTEVNSKHDKYSWFLLDMNVAG